MGKYLIKRLLHGLVSIICVVLIVMVLIYSLLDRSKIFAGDPNFNHTASNNRITYQQTRWEAFGYLDFVPYADYVNKLASDGQIDEATASCAWMRIPSATARYGTAARPSCMPPRISR